MVQLWKWVIPPPQPWERKLTKSNVTWLRCNWMIKSQSWVQPICEKGFALLEPKFSELIRIWVILDRLLCRKKPTEIPYWKYNNVSSDSIGLSWPADLWFLSLSVVSPRPFTPLSKTPHKGAPRDYKVTLSLWETGNAKNKQRAIKAAFEPEKGLH